MNRLIVDLGVGGDVSVSLQRGGELPERVGGADSLAWPLDGESLEQLRWYLEEYLRAPYGVFATRGERIADQLPAWGKAIFEKLFPAGPVREALAVARATGGVEIVFRSAAPEWLGLPWELLTDPDRPGPLVLDGVCIDRSLPVARLGQVFSVPGGRLRVLMVISRPAGTEDVGFHMIARPLLQRLDAVRGQVDLVVLRPPTLDRLREVLAQAQADGEPFQVVHFDGHGVLEGGRAGGNGGLGPLTFGAGGEGVLLFEKPGGGADRIPAAVVAQVLAGAKVPVVVLNACQSAAIGKHVEAAVATRLLQGGASSVVAMAYSVYAVAAAEFMTAFYERLFAGDSVSQAVTAGRAQLARKNERPSPTGLLPLADWLVPVHYLRAEARFPGLVTQRVSGAASLEESLDRFHTRDTEDDARDDLTPVGTFVGRDGLFYTLESAARGNAPILLHGPGGTGKTELAKAFGRWWQVTDGIDRPDWVVWHSLEPGVATFGVDGVIARVGAAVYGTQFSRLQEPGHRRTAVVEAMRSVRLLLILDNFESVASMPDPGRATPPLDNAEQADLLRFLVDASAGASTVLITSRTTEPWLGPNLRRVEVPGLAENEAVDYAEQLLTPHPASRPRRAAPRFPDLMRWLDGHPLSMRLILPRLDVTDPQVLLDELRGLTVWADDGVGGRTTSLATSIAYSFAHLDSVNADALAVLCFFHGVADADVLALFSSTDGIPARFYGLDRPKWETILTEAARTGLVTSLGAGMYGIQPALPAYLAARWRTDAADLFDQQFQISQASLANAHSELGRWLSTQIASGDAEFALEIINRQRHTLGAMLAHQLQRQEWRRAQAILQPLLRYWTMAGLHEEADRWTLRINHAVEDSGGAPPELNTDAGALWLFGSWEQANRQTTVGRHDAAGETYRGILARLLTQADSPGTQQRLAVAYHQLGMVAELRRDFDQAEDWYRQSLTIKKRLQNRSGMATTYHQLGIVAQRRGNIDQAEDWYRQALTINEQLHNRPGMAHNFHQLGMVADMRGDFDQAEDWYRQSLTIKEQLGDRSGMATTYHQLGGVAQRRGKLDQAEDWYRQSLTINEQLRNRASMATTYHQLGTVAQRRGKLDQAEDWYRQSLTINEQLRNRASMATTYHQLGTVAQRRGKLDQAEDWYRQSLTINEQLGDRPSMAATYGQLGLLAEDRGERSQALAWTIRSVSLFEQFPHPLSQPAPTHLRRLAQAIGLGETERLWQETTGSAMPDQIRQFLSVLPGP